MRLTTTPKGTRYRDPRREKLLNFRHAGHCHRARCGLCHPGKRWHRKAHRSYST